MDDPPLSDAEKQEREEFLQSLLNFMNSRKYSTPIERIPKLGHKEIDLYTLYNEVLKRGGMETVIAGKQWKEIADLFKLPPTCTNSGYTLRVQYLRFLFSFELFHFHKLPDHEIDQRMKKYPIDMSTPKGFRIVGKKDSFSSRGPYDDYPSPSQSLSPNLGLSPEPFPAVETILDVTDPLSPVLSMPSATIAASPISIPISLPTLTPIPTHVLPPAPTTIALVPAPTPTVQLSHVIDDEASTLSSQESEVESHLPTKMVDDPVGPSSSPPQYTVKSAEQQAEESSRLLLGRSSIDSFYQSNFFNSAKPSFRQNFSKAQKVDDSLISKFSATSSNIKSSKHPEMKTKGVIFQNRLAVSIQSQIPAYVSWALAVLKILSFEGEITLTEESKLLSVFSRELISLHEKVKEFFRDQPQTTPLVAADCLNSMSVKPRPFSPIAIPPAIEIKQKVKQMLKILFNLSCIEENKKAIAAAPSLVQILAGFLSLYSPYGKQVGNAANINIYLLLIETFANLSSYVCIFKLLSDRQVSSFLHELMNCICSSNQKAILAALETLKNLSHETRNEQIFLEVGDRLFQKLGELMEAFCKRRPQPPNIKRKGVPDHGNGCSAFFENATSDQVSDQPQNDLFESEREHEMDQSFGFHFDPEKFIIESSKRQFIRMDEPKRHAISMNPALRPEDTESPYFNNDEDVLQKAKIQDKEEDEQEEEEEEEEEETKRQRSANGEDDDDDVDVDVESDDGRINEKPQKQQEEEEEQKQRRVVRRRRGRRPLRRGRKKGRKVAAQKRVEEEEEEEEDENRNENENENENPEEENGGVEQEQEYDTGNPEDEESEFSQGANKDGEHHPEGGNSKENSGGENDREGEGGRGEGSEGTAKIDQNDDDNDNDNDDDNDGSGDEGHDGDSDGGSADERVQELERFLCAKKSLSILHNISNCRSEGHRRLAARSEVIRGLFRALSKIPECEEDICRRVGITLLNISNDLERRALFLPFMSDIVSIAWSEHPASHILSKLLFRVCDYLDHHCNPDNS